MEGLTGHVFRRVHAACFGALDRYYTPFLAPPRVGSAFGGRAAKEIDPVNNEGFNVVPQLLTNNASEFVAATRLLADMGYTEVNLNVGCPSGTVVAKGRGAGLLRDLDALDDLLHAIFRDAALPVSIKTRVGLRGDEEFEDVLELYCRYPLKELIIHPRVQQDQYRGAPRQHLYGEALARAPFPVAYNGDIFGLRDFDALCAAYPATRHVMLGRGILTNPALARELRGGAPATMSELRRFHDQLFAAYYDEMGGNAVFRMKEWWSYAQFFFAHPQSVHRAVRKVRTAEAYQAAVERVFQTEERAEAPRFEP